MEADTRARLEEMQAALINLRARRSIDDSVYFKGILSLASEYAEADDLHVASHMINECGPEYFGGAMVKQMQDDSAYRVVVHGLAKKLVDAGVVVLDDEPEYVLTTSKPAQA